MTSRALPASHRALLIVWPELATSSCGEMLAVGVDGLGESAQQSRAVTRRDVAPRWEGRARPGDRRVGCLDVERFDLGDDLLGRRVDHLHGYIRSKPRIRSQSVTAALNAASSTRAALA